MIIAFSDGTDADDNGYVDDIAGWDFLDDVQYGHGTGEARDSVSEANNKGDLGSCPNCMGVPLRVGDSFIADVSRFGAAVTYATDNGVEVVQEALGTLNNSSLARQAVNYNLDQDPYQRENLHSVGESDSEAAAEWLRSADPERHDIARAALATGALLVVRPVGGPGA